MISALIDKPKIRLKPVFIFIVALILVTIYSGFISFPSVLKYVYGSAFPISINQANILTSVYLAVYLICQIPAGLIIDRIKVHHSIFICAGLLLISLIGFSLSTNFISFLIFRFLMGVAVSFSFLLTIYIAKAFFSARYLTLLVALAELIFSVAMALTPYAVNYFSRFFSWKSLPLIIIILLVILCAAYLFCGLYKCHAAPNAIPQTATNNPIHHRMIDAFSCGWFWYVLIAVGIFYTRFALYTEIYAPTYIQSMYGASYQYSIFLNNAGIFGYMLGCLLLGFIAQWVEIRKLFFAAIVLSIIIYSLNVFAQNLISENFMLRYLDYFLLGYFSAYAMLIFRLYEIVSGKRLTALNGAALNMFNLVPLFFIYIYNDAFNISIEYAAIFTFITYLLAMVMILPILFKKIPPSARSGH